MNESKFLFKKRSKKRNFSEKEVAILTDEYEKHMLILNSRLTNSITNQKKQRIWERITDAINVVGVNRRRVSEVKEKWRNMQRKARRMFAERKINLRTTFEELDSLNLATSAPSVIGSRVVRFRPIAPDKQQQQQQSSQQQQAPATALLPQSSSSSSQQSLLDVQLESLTGGGGGGGAVVISPVDGIVGPTGQVVTTVGNEPGYSITAGSNTASVSSDTNCTTATLNGNNIINSNNSHIQANNSNNSLINTGNAVNNLLNGDNSNLTNDPVGVRDDLTIVIKEEVPDPVLKDEPLLSTEIQTEPVERVLTDVTSTEILSDAVTCNAVSRAENPASSYDYNSHKFTINLTDSNTDTTPHTSSRTHVRSQRPFTSLNSSKLRPLTGMSLSTKRMYSSPLSSARSFSRNRSGRNFLIKSSNNATVIPTSMMSQNAASASEPLLSSHSHLGRTYPISTSSLTSSALNHAPSLAATLPPHTAKSCLQSSVSSAGTVTQGDLLQLQYEVLLADKKRIQTQTRYYEMKMKRIEYELSGQSNTFF